MGKYLSIILFLPLGVRTEEGRSEVLYVEKSLQLLAENGYVANIYLLMMLFKLDEIEQRESLLNKLVSSETVVKSPEYELELPFYFSYRPPVIDDRVRNQFSIFVFQTFSANQYKFQNQAILVKQTIHPDFVIKAHNPSKIRSELTALGYTLKHIYCDYDSIARFTMDSINLL